jgi:hypothetical protein
MKVLPWRLGTTDPTSGVEAAPTYSVPQVRFRRNLRLQPKTVFSRFPLLRRAGLGSPRSAPSATLLSPRRRVFPWAGLV